MAKKATKRTVHSLTAKRKEALQFYVSVFMSVVVGLSSAAIAYFAMVASDKQAQMAELTYRLERAKNAPDFRIERFQIIDGVYKSKIKLESGFARIFSIEVVVQLMANFTNEMNEKKTCLSDYLQLDLKDKS